MAAASAAGLLKSIARMVLTIAGVLILAISVLSRGRSPDLLIWGPDPILNIKYWSEAMRASGRRSITLVSTFYSINRREDFDLYYEDLLPRRLRSAGLVRTLGPFLAAAYVVRHAAVIHIPYSGGPLGRTVLARLEPHLLRRVGVKTVVIPYGADVFMYSTIVDPAIRHGLLLSYPNAGRDESRIRQNVERWSRHADVIATGFTLDGISRWDIPVGNMVVVDTSHWQMSRRWSQADGERGTVRILHAPNHRGAKGTEFLITAVEVLQAQGLKLELVLAERLPNEKIRELLQQVDILADQLVLPGYGLAAVEGMASGLPVIANLESQNYTTLFRRYSYLGECPIVSAGPESIGTVLLSLIRDPALRESAGRAGRAYVERYHSYDAARYLFGAIHRHLEGDPDVDLMSLYHPSRTTRSTGPARSGVTLTREDSSAAPIIRNSDSSVRAD